MEQLDGARQDILISTNKINDFSTASSDAKGQLESARSQLAALQNDFDKLQQASKEAKV